MEPSGVRAAAAAAAQLQYARADVHADGFPDGVVSSLRGLHQSALGFCIYGEEKGRRPVRRADVVSHPNHGAVVHSVRFAPSESGSQRHLEAHRDGRPNDHEQTNDTAAGISTAIVHADLFAHCEADHPFANGNLQADNVRTLRRQNDLDGVGKELRRSRGQLALLTRPHKLSRRVHRRRPVRRFQ